MEKFHYFLYGKEFTLETDQKPLVSIYKKHMVDISPRVQRLIVRSFPYQTFNVIYKRGKDIPVTDALSRVTPMDPEDNIKLPIIAVNLITVHILLSAHPQDTFFNLGRVQHRAINSQDSAITSTQASLVRRRICRQIFKNIGTTGIHYPSKMDLLPVDLGSLFHKRCEQRCYSTSMMDIRIKKDAY